MIRTTIAALLLIATTAFAAERAEKATAKADTAATGTAIAQSTTATAIDADSRRTRDELSEILRRYPPELPQVLKLDPTLFANSAYMANYPALATFVNQHPEVAHNPDFFLESFPNPRERNLPPSGYRAFREILGDVGGFVVFLVLVSVFVWGIKTLIEQRRWNRLNRMQIEVHSKLLDRFTSNEELLAYMQTPPGRRFLESAPIPLEAGPRPISAPVSRIFWSLQAGLVAIAFGVALDIVSMRTQGHEVSEYLYGVGMVGLLIGIALVASAGLFYALSRKFGLWSPPAAPSDAQ